MANITIKATKLTELPGAAPRPGQFTDILAQAAESGLVYELVCDDAPKVLGSLKAAARRELGRTIESSTQGTDGKLLWRVGPPVKVAGPRSEETLAKIRATREATKAAKVAK